MKEKLDPIYDAILDGDMRGMEALVQDALDAKLDVGMILHECLIPAMDEVGRLFEEGDYFVPEMLIAAMAMKAGLAVLRPLLAKSDIEPTGQVVIGTVKGDMHDIGKNLVGMMLEGAGFEIEDLGVDVDPDQFVAAIKDKGADIVGLSALLTTTMPSIEKTIKAIDAAGLRDQVKILVGGAPVTKAYAEAVGADGFATDAGQASALAKQFVK